MVDHDEIAAARRALGRHLAHLRKDAGHTQHGLARLVQYGRSSVANTETGRHIPSGPSGSAATGLRTGGVLTAEYDRIADLDHNTATARRPTRWPRHLPPTRQPCGGSTRSASPPAGPR